MKKTGENKMEKIKVLAVMKSDDNPFVDKSLFVEIPARATKKEIFNILPEGTYMYKSPLRYFTPNSYAEINATSLEVIDFTVATKVWIGSKIPLDWIKTYDRKGDKRNLIEKMKERGAKFAVKLINGKWDIYEEGQIVLTP